MAAVVAVVAAEAAAEFQDSRVEAAMALEVLWVMVATAMVVVAKA